MVLCVYHPYMSAMLLTDIMQYDFLPLNVGKQVLSSIASYLSYASQVTTERLTPYVRCTYDLTNNNLACIFS